MTEPRPLEHSGAVIERDEADEFLETATGKDIEALAQSVAEKRRADAAGSEGAARPEPSQRPAGSATPAGEPGEGSDETAAPNWKEKFEAEKARAEQLAAAHERAKKNLTWAHSVIGRQGGELGRLRGGRKDGKAAEDFEDADERDLDERPAERGRSQLSRPDREMFVAQVDRYFIDNPDAIGHEGELIELIKKGHPRLRVDEFDGYATMLNADNLWHREQRAASAPAATEVAERTRAAQDAAANSASTEVGAAPLAARGALDDFASLDDILDDEAATDAALQKLHGALKAGGHFPKGDAPRLR